MNWPELILHIADRLILVAVIATIGFIYWLILKD